MRMQAALRAASKPGGAGCLAAVRFAVVGGNLTAGERHGMHCRAHDEVCMVLTCAEPYPLTGRALPHLCVALPSALSARRRTGGTGGNACLVRHAEACECSL